VETARELPCPHCGARIALSLYDFFPTRRRPILCKNCRQAALLPLRAVLPGLGALVLVMAAEMFVLKVLGAHRPDSIPGLLGAGAVLALVGLSASWAGCLICKISVDRLQPWRR